MGTFITQTTTPDLYLTKTPAPGATIPPGLTAANVVQAADLNTIENSLLDTRAAIRGQAFSALNYGAVGDGVADDTAAVQSAITAAAAAGGGVVTFPRVGAFYRITGTLNVASNVALLGDGTELRQVTANTTLLSITGSNVSVARLTLRGPQHIAQQVLSTALHAVGPSAASPLEGLRVTGCRFLSWGYMAVRLRYVQRVDVSFNDFQDIYYAGFYGDSVVGGRVAGNRISNVVGSPNAYGITLTRQQTDTLATDPRSADVTVFGNSVTNVLNWTGIDTHGGERIAITGNTIRGCPLALLVGPADNSLNVNTFAPRDCTVVGNTIDSGNTAGTALEGITFKGAGTGVGTFTELATGVVVGNLVRGHGQDTVTTSGGIRVYYTQGLVLQGNTVAEASPHGILVWNDNYGISVQSNTVVDAWSATVAQAGGIRVRDQQVNGTMTDNVFVRGTKVAANVMATGFRFDTTVNVAVAIGQHDYAAVTTSISGGTSNALRPLVQDSAFSTRRAAPTYGPTVAILARDGNTHSITANNTTAFTISNPTNPTVGQVLRLTIRNTSIGALGNVTFDTAFKVAGANPWVLTDGSALSKPANGFSRTIAFQYDGTNWVEIGRTPGDVAN